MDHSHRRRVEEQVVRELLLALALLLIALLQVGLPPHPFAFFPNLLLLLVTCRAMLMGWGNAARWALYGGLAFDICAATQLGVHALALLMAMLAALLVLAPFQRSTWLMPLVGVPIGALAYHLVIAVITHLLVAPVEPLTYLLVAAIPEMLATLVPALPVFLLMRWYIEQRRSPVRLGIY